MIFLMLIPPFVVGVPLVVLTIKRREKGLLRIFLLTAGASLIGFPVFAALHNLFYGLAEMVDIVILERILEFLHAAFFCIAVIVCPAGFLVGLVGSIVLIVRKHRARDRLETKGEDSDAL